MLRGFEQTCGGVPDWPSLCMKSWNSARSASTYLNRHSGHQRLAYAGHQGVA